MSSTPESRLPANESFHLGQLSKGQEAVITGMASASGDQQRATRTRLLELGFVPGETVRVVAVSFPQGDPMAIRLGNSTFALRRHEAALVQVQLPGQAHQ